MQLTREKAVEYFDQKAPKKLREQGIIKMEEYAKGDESIFFFNDEYVIRYIVPEASNFLMRNQNFSQILKGSKFPKKDIRFFMDRLTQKGYLKR